MIMNINMKQGRFVQLNSNFCYLRPATLLQVHISMAGPNKVQVTWVTSDPSAPSHVQFGTRSGIYDQEAEGSSLTYIFLLYRYLPQSFCELDQIE